MAAILFWPQFDGLALSESSMQTQLWLVYQK